MTDEFVMEDDFHPGGMARGLRYGNGHYPHNDNIVTYKDADKHNYERYKCDTVRKIQAVYIIASLLWVVLIASLHLWKYNYIVLLLLLLPVVVYVINFTSLGDFSRNLEDEMFRGNLLSFGFLVAIILINWNTPLTRQNKTEFFKILIVAFILLMISLIDVWVSPDNLSIAKHVETSLHTASLSLLALGLYLYYTYHRDQASGVLI